MHTVCIWLYFHDDNNKWKRFPCYWPFVRGNLRSSVDSPHTGQWRGALMFSLTCAWTDGWPNNRDAGVFRQTPSLSLWRHCNAIRFIPISLMVSSLALGQSYDWPSAREATIKIWLIRRKNLQELKTKNNDTKHNKTLWLLYESHSTSFYLADYDSPFQILATPAKRTCSFFVYRRSSKGYFATWIYDEIKTWFNDGIICLFLVIESVKTTSK